MLRPMHLRGAQVLRPGGFSDAVVGIYGGVLSDDSCGRAVDLSGWWILPGIVDAHGDGFERHLAPRRGALLDLRDGLAMSAAELAVNGITTAMLAQFFSWEGGMRSPEFAAEMLTAHAAIAPSQAVDLRVQLRIETHLTDRFDEAAALIARHGIGYVVFNDHVPHKALAAGKRPPRLTGQALKSGRSPEAHLALLQALHERSSQVPAALEALIVPLLAKGVILGSHDDPDAEVRAQWQSRGVVVSEFPESVEAARAAGTGVVLGAPNVVRGASHTGNVSATALVAEGLCDALASDYHYPAPRQAALKLAQSLGMEVAWGLVSSGPARLLGLSDRGRIEAGLRADIAVVDPVSGRVGATISGGRLAWLGPELAGRFLG
jgi:alpha-D-ribose 1-methylphosphonate 5-triphosphate diphosphatase